jgi:hypothetical protein
MKGGWIFLEGPFMKLPGVYVHLHGVIRLAGIHPKAAGL